MLKSMLWSLKVKKKMQGLGIKSGSLWGIKQYFSSPYIAQQFKNFHVASSTLPLSLWNVLFCFISLSGWTVQTLGLPTQSSCHGQWLFGRTAGGKHALHSSVKCLLHGKYCADPWQKLGQQPKCILLLWMISWAWNLPPDNASWLHKVAIKHKERSGFVGTTRSGFEKVYAASANIFLTAFFSAIYFQNKLQSLCRTWTIIPLTHQC